MNKLRFQFNSTMIYFLASLFLIGCSGEETQETEQQLELKQETSFVYVEREITQQVELMEKSFEQKLTDIRQSPLDIIAPYQFNPGAKLILRNGLDVNATESNILSAYFGENEEYDVKDLNVSKNGKRLLFAARGSNLHPTDPTWNIFVYNFETKQLKRIIENAFVANSGDDTNPTFTDDNQIIFSSDRDAGNPEFPRENIELVGDLCRKVDPAENPFLLHSMSISGENITQLTYGRFNHDVHPTTLKDGRIAFVRWERSYQPLASCLLTENTQTSFDSKTKPLPNGLNSPRIWTEDTQCSLAKLTPNGAVVSTNFHKILTISSDGKQLEQLYNTVTQEPSEASFLTIDKIFQGESGNLFGLLKHQYNPVLGGELLEFQSFQTSGAETVFSEFSPKSLSLQTINLYPDELSDNGWFSAFWPYRDGTSRLLVSWAKCTLVNNGVSQFCDASDGQGELDLQYGIWMLDPTTMSSSPIVRAKDNKVISDIAVFQSHKGKDLELTPYDPDFIDNPDATKVLCEFPNNQPIALAGLDQNGYLGDVFNFNASQSNDPDGDPLTFYWTVKTKPNNSQAVITDNTRVNPTFTPDKVGSYEIELTVNDGELDSLPDSLGVVVVLNNTKPVANAGVDQTAAVASLVKLDGSGSGDPEGDSLTYRWLIINQPTNSASILTNPSSVTPEFTPDLSGTYIVQLIVNDGLTDSAPDTANIVVEVQNNNNIPIANAGADQNVAVNAGVSLNGSASRDPDGDSLTYRWSFLSIPNGSSVSLFSGNSVNPTFTPDEEGDYLIQLIVNDGQLDSQADVVTVTAERPNTKPVANAGADKMSRVDQLVNLDGSASHDADGDNLSYAWSIISQPANVPVVLNNPTSVAPNFTATVQGNYVIQLVVNDGLLFSEADTVSITVAQQNRKPIADAGIDQTATINARVSLDGSRSSDPDSDPLTYQWQTVTQPDGSGVILSNPSAVNPTFVADKTGSYVFQLIVNDGFEASDKDIVSVSVNDPQGKPIANAGADQNGLINQVYSFDGSASSDPDGDALTYAWSIVQLPDGSSASLQNSNQVVTQITADKEGTYIIQLIVNDGGMDSLADVASLVTSKPNTRPVANAGDDQRFRIDQVIYLDGSASHDIDGDSLTYQWRVISPAVNAVAINNPTSVAPNISIPDDRTYTLELVVFDGVDYSSADTVQVSFNNTKPIAHAGADQTSSAGSLVQLDGSASTDIDGDLLTYQWSIVTRPDASVNELSDASIVNPTSTLDASGIYQLSLVVNDGYLDSEPDFISINSIDNTAPVAVAGDDQNIEIGQPVLLDGSASYDVNGDALTYSWSLLHKPQSSTAVLQGANSVSPSIVADVYGEYVVQLIVNDGVLDSLPDTLMLNNENLRPVANAGIDQTAETSMQVTLDGSLSYDPNGDSISYQWDIIHKPVNSNTSLSGTQVESPTFTPDLRGTYVAQLIVNDGVLDSQPDTVSIEVGEVAVCEISNETNRILPIIIRDFQASHPDFEYRIGVDYGIVKDQLGVDGLPVYANEYGTTNTTTGTDNFNQWYRDVLDVNLNIPKTLEMTRASGSTIWEYSNSNFFPIDGEGYGNSGLTNPDHNFHFTLEMHLVFDYQGGEVFSFQGDDDLWLFIDGQLVIDIGGVHSVLEKTVDIDQVAGRLGITPGNRYSFDLFFAERHVTQSNFKFQTNIELECIDPQTR